MGNLEGLPVSNRMSNGRSSSYTLQKFRKLQTSHAMSLIDHQNEDETILSKSDVTLQFTLEVRNTMTLLHIIKLSKFSFRLQSKEHGAVLGLTWAVENSNNAIDISVKGYCQCTIMAVVFLRFHYMYVLFNVNCIFSLFNTDFRCVFAMRSIQCI